jgi:nucleoid-associated protein YgaU
LPQSYHGLNEVDLLANLKTYDHTWQHGDRLDKLSNKFYGDDQYAWLIALVNNIGYQLGIQPGTVVRVPVEVIQVLERLDMV